MSASDLTVETFLILRQTFFEATARPRKFSLRQKSNTQDDPLDEYIAGILASSLAGVTCQRSGPLVSPDMVIYRSDLCENVPRSSLNDDLSRIVGLEVKKLQRNQQSGQVARSTGLDYNTTPPCSKLRIYDATSKSVDVRGFYIFVCQEQAEDDEVYISALVLCDGGIINRNFEFYLSITGQREKGLGLGTYGDGFNRQRPMLVFPNPLGAVQLDRACTLVTSADFASTETRVSAVYEIGRTIPEGGEGLFYAYRVPDDIPAEWEVGRLVDPFPKPRIHQSKTHQRGMFRLPIRVMGD